MEGETEEIERGPSRRNQGSAEGKSEQENRKATAGAGDARRREKSERNPSSNRILQIIYQQDNQNVRGRGNIHGRRSALPGKSAESEL